MKKSSVLLSVLLASALGLTACGKDKANFTTAQMVDAVIAQIKTERPDQPVPDEARKQIEESLTLNLAAAEAARKDKLDADPTTQALIQAQTVQILASQYFSKKMAEYKPSDDDLKKMYDSEVKKATEELHLRHILLETEAQANEVLSKLKAGDKFEELAKQSKDTPSAAKGGDLGWNPLARWVPEFAEAAGKLKSGELSAPVKSQFGYHVIQLVEEPRAAAQKPQIPPFEQVKPQILEAAKAKHLKELQDEFKKTAATAAKPEVKK
ncbi:MAG: peptidylprolyl isomerase [Formosimonas sp.]